MAQLCEFLSLKTQKKDLDLPDLPLLPLEITDKIGDLVSYMEMKDEEVARKNHRKNFHASELQLKGRWWLGSLTVWGRDRLNKNSSLMQN